MIATLVTNAIPLELRRVPQWVCWKLDRRNGDKPTKIPVNPRNMKLAKSDERATWGTYRDAYHAAIRAGMGIGFVFSPADTFCGIDLDGCIQGGVIHPAADALVEAFSTYTEVSPSGTGLKMFLRGKKPNKEGCSLAGTKAAEFGCTRIEVYDHLRFFTVTGNHLEVTAITDSQLELSKLCNRLWPPRPVRNFSVPQDVSISDREKRCAAYVSRYCPAAISGQGGHNATLRVACEAFRFGLDDQGAMRILESFNETRCLPPWSQRELHHKLACAHKKVSTAGEVGRRLSRRAN